MKSTDFLVYPVLKTGDTMSGNLHINASLNVDGSIFQWNSPFVGGGGGGQWTTAGTAIYYNGSVGISTVFPSSMLDVSGQITASGANGGILVNRAGAEPYIAFNYSSSMGAQLRGINGGGLRLTDSTSVVEWLRCTSTGAVAIGTTSPKTKLHVLSGIASDVYVGGLASGGFAVSNNNQLYGISMGVKSSGNAWMQVGRFDGDPTVYNLEINASGGAVTIGSTGATVSTQGNSYHTGGVTFIQYNLGTAPSAWAQQLAISSVSDNQLVRISFAEGGDGLAMIEAGRQVSQYHGYLAFKVRPGPTEYSEEMRLTETGLGIGTVSPRGALDVSINSLTGFYTVDNTDGIVLANPNNTIGLSTSQYGNYNSSPNQVWYKQSGGATGSHNFGTNGTSQFYISANGSIGIGTTVPYNHVHICGSLGNGGSVSDKSMLFDLRIGASDGRNIKIGYANISTLGVIQSFYTTETTYYHLLLNPYGGNVGIGAGMYNPGKALNVMGDIKAEKNLIVGDGSIAGDSSTCGILTRMRASQNFAFGDVGKISSGGTIVLAKADVIANANAILMCADISIATGREGYWMMQGSARLNTWNWTVGELIYLSLSGTTGNTLTQTAPSGTDNVVQVLGVATNPDMMIFSPSLVQIEHI